MLFHVPSLWFLTLRRACAEGHFWPMGKLIQLLRCELQPTAIWQRINQACLITCLAGFVAALAITVLGQA